MRADPSPVARGRGGRLVLAAALTGLLSVGCVDQEGGDVPTSGTTTAASAPGCPRDQDCDAILDNEDAYAQRDDGADADGDGVLNGPDAAPHDPAVSTVSDMIAAGDPRTQAPAPQAPAPQAPPPAAQQGTQIGAQQSTGLVCGRYTTRDGDGDGLPDDCDVVFELGQKDSDDDGLADLHDTYPHTRDRDGDGRLDGYDPDPDVDEQRERDRLDEERRAEQRLEEQRLEQQRERDRLERERLEAETGGY